MADLKFVKANPRETTEQYFPSKFSRVPSTRTVKTHDLEIHDDKGRPLFSVSKNQYTKGYKLAWHPYMTEKYPDLQDSFEHGSRQRPLSHNSAMAAESKDNALYTAQRIYAHAARSGFKDEIPHQTIPEPTEERPMAHRIVFRDPETSEPIVTQRDDGIGNKKIAFHSPYLGKNGISPDVVSSMNHGGSGYVLAQKIRAERGNDVTGIGVKTFPGKSSDHYSHLFKANSGKSDEELSAAHEALVRKQLGDKPNFQLVRHSPTVFHAEGGKGGDTPYDNFHVTSLAHGGRLVSHKINPDYQYSGEKNEQRF